MTTPTPAGLTRAAAVATIAAGALFAGVQIGHPHLDPTTIGSTEVVIRSSLKVLMCALALAGFTGMYLGQIRRNGLLGLVGYAVISAGYLLVLATTAGSDAATYGRTYAEAAVVARTRRYPALITA